MKLILIFSFILMTAFHIYLEYLSDSYNKKELPENVRDVYDEKEYERWRQYSHENKRMSRIDAGISFVIEFVLLAFNLYAWVFDLFDGFNLYVQYLLMISCITLLTLPKDIFFSYYDTFVIEEKYGMNKTTKKTFVLDQIKGAVIGILLTCILLLVVMGFFETFGNKGMLGVILAIIGLSLLINLLVMPLLRIFNKFQPLEEGELKTKLLELCTKYGVRVKRIVVRDASRRTTKANAFCTGLFKEKTISLDDNLVNEFETNQIVAVFAHEFAHAREKHMLRSLPFAILRTVLTIVVLGLLFNLTSIYEAFGFSEMNYFFAFTILNLVSWPVSNLLDLISNYISRKHEYEADAFATKEGYGDDLIAGLKKLSKEAMSNINPHPWIVALEYSHPTLSQRISACEKLKK